MALSDNLAKFRNRLNLTRKEVADKIGVTLPAYTNYEAGNRSPHVDQLPKIAAALQVSVDQLLDYNVPNAEREAGLAKWAGLDVAEENGLYSVAGIIPRARDMFDTFESEYLEIAQERLNLAPLPAAAFDKAVKLARQHVIDENCTRFILWILRMIDHQNYLIAQEKKELPPYEKALQRKKPPAE